MSNITQKTKIILFVGLLVAIILPFSNIVPIDALAVKESKEKKTTEKNDTSKKKEKSKVKEKPKEYTYEEKSNYKKKDLHNYKADLVLEKMNPLLKKMPTSNNNNTSNNMHTSTNLHPSNNMTINMGASMAPTNNITIHNKSNLEIVVEKQQIKTLQKELEKVTKEHKEKIIDKDVRKDLKKARQLIIDSGIPTNMIATGIDHLYIKLSKENAKYEEEIIELLKDVPYLIEYGDGFKRNSCETTQSDCNYEIGGIQIQIKAFPFVDETCTLSIPMKKDGVDGFLTAAHCFHVGYSEDVYQPDTSSESNIIGHSNSTWRSFEHNGECDCAWIKDTSNTQQKSGVFAYENAYWATLNTHVPSIGEPAMLRGVFANNGEYNWANIIEFDDVVISDWYGLGKTTINLMSFPAPTQPGDSGGAAFFGSSYIGIVIGGGLVNGTMYTIFVPWDHVTENISGLELTPHP